MMINTMSLEQLSWTDMTLPDLVDGSVRTHSQVEPLIRAVAEKRCQRRRGVTYDPNTIQDRRFRKVITIDECSIGQTFVIHTGTGDIIAHSPAVDIPNEVVNGVDYFLRVNGRVRTSDPFETGVMVAMGERVDYRSCTITKYAPKKPKRNSLKELNNFLLNTAVAAKNYLLSTPLKGYVEKDLTQLSKKNSAWLNNSTCSNNINSDALHPTYAASEDLTNSPHFDNNCGRGFAVFFREKNNQTGVTYLVFPMIGLAIKCCRAAIV